MAAGRVVDIVCSMVPLASSSGLAVIGGAVSLSVLLLMWLLRGEARDEAREEALEQAKREKAQGGEPDGDRKVEPHGVG